MTEGLKGQDGSFYRFEVKHVFMDSSDFIDFLEGEDHEKVVEFGQRFFSSLISEGDYFTEKDFLFFTMEELADWTIFMFSQIFEQRENLLKHIVAFYFCLEGKRKKNEGYIVTEDEGRVYVLEVRRVL